MKKKFKQALASLLIVVMALTGMPLGNFILPRLTANAAYEPTPESCFTYTVTNGEATITGFDKSVTDVVIPETLGGYPVTEIGEKAFSGCKNIGNVIFPEGLKTIGAYAFNGCSGLRNIDFPETLQTIGNDAFLSCSNIASLVIPDGVTDIGGEAFCYCSKLEKLVVGNGVKKIGGRAFEKTALKDITLGNSVEYLGIDSFAYCPMTGIVLPESLEVLEGGNFQGCKNLKSLTIPRNVKEIGTGLFRNCVSLEEIKVVPDNQYFTSDEYGALFTKDMREMLKYPVGNQRRSYTVPASVESVYYHYNLDDSAFYDCRNLDEIFVDENNKYLSSDEYGVLFDKEKTKLFNYPAGNPRKTYEIPDTVTTITSDSFYACSGIEEPIIPDSVTTIEKDAFFKCFSLRKVVIPDSVTSPLEYTFWDCDNLEEAYIGNGVSVIDTFAFADCGSLRFLSLGNGIKKIGFAAFFCCYNLEDVYYSGTVSDWYAVELNTLEDESSPVYYTEKFYANGELIEDLTIPDDITSLDTYHFYGYDGLKSLTIPSHVTDVAASAFYGCNNLASINILNNELNISTKAFGFLSSGKINPITTIYSHCGSTAETYVS